MVTINWVLRIADRSEVFLLNNSWHSSAIRILVSIIMIVLYLWILEGICNLIFHLVYSFPIGWSHEAEHIITDLVIILAVLELIRTLQSYLLLGRVKVTFILDAALVVLIGELIALWYRQYTNREVFFSLCVIALLVFLRIITSKFSPDTFNEE